MAEVVNTLKIKILIPIESILIVAGTMLFLWGVVEFIAGASNEDKRTQGKRHMIWGIVGLAIIWGARGIIEVLKNFFT
ncbi:MAG: hypothetical protein AAB556_02030 [Patescibacteria group bacterium]